MNKAITITVRSAFCLLTLGFLPIVIIFIGGLDDLRNFITAEDI